MQIVYDFLNEVVVSWILVYLFQVVLGEHAWDLATAEQIVDVFEERLVDHMVFGEDEADLLILEGSQFHYLEDILAELDLAVIFSYLNLLQLALTHNSTKRYHRFLTRTTQAN